MKMGVLQKWRKNEGDKVSPGEVIAEVETDKAVMDFEAFDEGVLLKRLIADGASVPVGTPIAIIGKTGEDISKLVEEAASRASGAKPAAKAEPAKTAAPAPAPKAPPAPAPAAANGKSAKPAPAAAAPAPAAKRAPAPAAAAPAPAPAGGKVLASPLARKLATDMGIDLRGITGTGPGGRIVERDVKAAAEGGGGTAADRLARGGGSAADVRAARIDGRAAARADRPRAPHRGPPGPGGPGRGSGQAAVDDAPDDRGAAARGEDDGSALLPDRRHRHGRGDGVPRAGRAGPRRQAVGQRPGAQGVRARAAQGAGGERVVHRGSDHPARACRHRHGGGHRRRPHHPGHP